VIVAMALAFALVAGTGLLVRTLMNLQRVDAGFDSRNVLTLTPDGSYATPAARLAYLRTLIERVEAVPGVEAAGIVSNVPLSRVETWPMRVDDRPPADASVPPAADLFWVSPGYFAALRIPLRRGRMLEEHDGDPNAEHAALISETLARLHFNGVDPIGHHIRVGPGSPAPTLRIVGIVGDVRYTALDRSPGAAIYIPQGVNANHYTRLVARTSGDPMRFERAIRSAIRDIDPTQPVFHVQPMDDYVASSLADRRFALTLVTLFGAVALLLAAIGIYGVVSYSVLQRTAEIGVRVALGATRIDVVSMIMRQAVGLSAGGLAAGAVVTFVSTRFLQSLLFEVGAMDWPTLVITAAIFTSAATIASVIPARSASRVDPLTAIRVD
jgi:putative ABC transport system permease protein